MATYQQKTLPTDASVDAFLAGVEPPSRADDARGVMALMHAVSGETATMWGGAIIGFGHYAYTYASGHSGVSQRIGLSPRKANLAVYLPGLKTELADFLPRLGRHKLGGGCLYLNGLAGVDMGVLREMIAASWEHIGALYP
jgi:hypothetical protein